MNGVYMNQLMYADDQVLIAPSVYALQVLLRYCDSFAQDNDVKYNVNYLSHSALVFYCASLWSSYTIESLRHLKVAYNRIFCILMGMHHRARMLENSSFTQ